MNHQGRRLFARPLLAALIAGTAAAQHASSGRATVEGRNLLLDGEPWLIRGVSYSPTPLDQDPDWSGQDYHSAAYAGMHRRDIELLAEMGTNSIRVYDLGHTDLGQRQLWDMLGSANITVFAGMDLHIPECGSNCGPADVTKHPDWMDLGRPVNMERVKQELRAM